jgi:hypothetical protein
VAGQNFSVIGVKVDAHRSLVDLGEATVSAVALVPSHGLATVERCAPVVVPGEQNLIAV